MKTEKNLITMRKEAVIEMLENATEYLKNQDMDKTDELRAYLCRVHSCLKEHITATNSIRYFLDVQDTVFKSDFPL